MSGHGHGHGHGEFDFEAEMARGMPSPFCHGNWRMGLAGLGLSGAFVLGYAVWAHTGAADPALATNATMATPVAMATAGAMTAPPFGSIASGQPVAMNSPTNMGETAAVGPDVRLVASRRTAFNAAATAVRPSVVGIRVVVATAPGVPPMSRVGSGVIVSEAGHVVTCRHVIADATSISVDRFRMPGERLQAELVAVEEDLALIRLRSQERFDAAVLGDSEATRVGDWVLAIGHPFGLGLTVTAGIVGRRHTQLSLPGGGLLSDLIQTDAPINEGSSGGPLVDMDGRVIGLNTAIYAPTGVFSGTGFAIPSNRVRQLLARHLPGVAAAIVQSPRRDPATLGIGLTDLTPSLAAQQAFPYGSGVVVSAVTVNSAAAAAQLAPGDIITSVEGQPVQDVSTATAALQRAQPGQAVPIQVWRLGGLQTLFLQPPPQLPG